MADTNPPNPEDPPTKADKVEAARDGKATARSLPPKAETRLPSRAEFRTGMPRMAVGSEVYIREDRDKR